jgi:alpha-N-arabinofuranosidase
VSRIKLDLDRTLGTVDREIFGGFIEHEGRSIYGGVVDKNPALTDERGFRNDVADAIRGLNSPILRWPGGNFVSGYHWENGIGPKEQRTPRIDLAWNAVESNQFGTDEFFEYCDSLGTEPYVCFNMGTGTLEEALAWVEYCNGDRDTYWANRRRENGHPEPYGVTYWGLGNEMWGDWQVGHMTARAYAEEAKRWALALRRLDPTIKLVACGRNGWDDWDELVINELVRYVDYHSIHMYSGSDDHLSSLFSPHQADRSIKAAQAMIDRARYLQHVERPVRVIYDEWNVWFATRNDRRADRIVAERHTLVDALAVATYLNVFTRNCAALHMANMAQLVNVLAPIVTDDDGMFLQAIYHPFQLSSARTLPVALDAFVDAEKIDFADIPNDRVVNRVADLGPFSVLDVAATRDEGRGTVAVCVVNRSLDGSVATDIELGRGVEIGSIAVEEINAETPETVNSFENPHAVGVQAKDAVTEFDGDRFRYDFPAHSVTWLTITLAG